MNKNYARLSTRIKAAILDGIFIMLLIYSLTQLFEIFESVPNYLKIIAFILIFLLYEPILVTVFGATAGHFFNDILVKKENDQKKNLSFFQAVFRFILKATLGWLSLLTINGSEKSQAIHDNAVGSVVIPYENKK